MSNATTIKILYADDDSDDRLFLDQSFQSSGFKADLALVANGEEAIRYLETASGNHSLPALIILDINMPKLDGRETLKYLKKHPTFAAIPVVILSTSENIHDKDFCLGNGVLSYFKKPYHIEGYQLLIRSLLPYVATA